MKEIVLTLTIIAEPLGLNAIKGTLSKVWKHIWLLQVALSSERPGMLTDILQGTGKSPTAKNYMAPNVNSAEVEKPSSIGYESLQQPYEVGMKSIVIFYSNQ